MMANNTTNVNATAAGSPPCGSPTISTFQFYTWGIVSNIVSLYGIVGNILSIVVLSHRQMRNSTSYYLISLAIYDMIVCLCMSLFLALPTIYNEKAAMEEYYFAYIYMHPFVYPIALIAQTGTVYTTLAFTIERYIAVCRPLHAANTCTMSRTKRVILLIFLASITYNIPRFLEYQTGTIWNKERNRTEPRIEPTEFGKNKLFKEIYFIYAYLVIMFLIPFILLTILNICLMRAVNKARARRSSIASSNSRETNLTFMLIVIINVFLVCQLPALIDNILFAIFDKKTLNCSAVWEHFTTVSNLLITINSSINFILYCLLSKRFRRVFLKIFHFKKPKPRYQYTVQQSSFFLRHNNHKPQVYGTRSYDITSALL